MCVKGAQERQLWFTHGQKCTTNVIYSGHCHLQIHYTKSIWIREVVIKFRFQCKNSCSPSKQQKPPAVQWVKSRNCCHFQLLTTAFVYKNRRKHNIKFMLGNIFMAFFVSLPGPLKWRTNVHPDTSSQDNAMHFNLGTVSFMQDTRRLCIIMEISSCNS